jgi:hypothetical protein
LQEDYDINRKYEIKFTKRKKIEPNVFQCFKMAAASGKEGDLNFNPVQNNVLGKRNYTWSSKKKSFSLFCSLSLSLFTKKPMSSIYLSQTHTLFVICKTAEY